MADGLLIVNADDWGLDRATTSCIADCVASGAVSAVSAMVFMEDSERAAWIAAERAIPAGLHLNLTTAFSARGCETPLVDHQRAIAAYLRRHRFAQLIFHPGLHRSFTYVVNAQLDEFRRLYGAEPDRVDGHHHMHLCANVLLGNLLPAGTVARRNFSFLPGEKTLVNRLYRQLVDRVLARHHRLTDFFFSLPPFEPSTRLQRIFALARRSVVELETHPARADEYRYLQRGEILRQAQGVRIGAPSNEHKSERHEDQR
jgi:chitin disaccharide deacetylase